jgi:hypothetical protein
MSRTQRAITLLVVQAVLVLSIAGKYLYERKTCPRVWVRSAQYDPNLVLRGRYLSLQLMVDACALPRDEAHHVGAIVGSNPPDLGYWQWNVRPIAQNGKLVPVPASYNESPEMTDTLTLWGRRPCDRATLDKQLDYYIPDTAQTPFPLKPGEELWVEVTVPPLGPPRPIQLALAKDGAFTPLALH